MVKINFYKFMSPKMTRAKKILFYFIIFVLMYILIELFSLATYFFIKGKIFSFSEIRNCDFSTQSIPICLEPQNIHPYVGFVTTLGKREGISDFGFTGSESPIQKESDDKVIVGIFGGSVAARFYFQGRIKLEEELRKSLFFRDKKFIFLNFGMGGYKQPQQLMILNYILAHGGHLDIVINLDGFNDIVLPVVDNIPHNVYPFFPRAWHLRASDVKEPDALGMIAKIVSLKEKRERLVILFLKTPFRYCIAANLALKWYCNRYLLQKINHYRLQLLRHKGNRKHSYSVTGPAFHYENEHDMYVHIANFWKNCSFQMCKICTANNIYYVHFLQPNQYVPNSKIIKEEERKIAVKDGHIYRKPAAKGYPYLRKAGRELQDRGVSFHDLTMIFANIEEPLYIDNACQLNKKGNEIIAEKIAEIIIEAQKE